ncbi:MAG: hypothetical protein RIQ54_227, partial [Candidatus Parcubacteria bacterium]
MKRFFMFIFFTLSLIGSIHAAEKNNEKLNCHWRLQLEFPNSKKTCFSDYSLEKELYSGRKLIDLTKTANCYSIALSTDQQCKGIGYANTWDQFCDAPKGVELQQKDALESCKKSGCSCELVISSHKIINEDLLLAWSNKSSSPTDVGENTKLVDSKNVKTENEDKLVETKKSRRELNKSPSGQFHLRVTTTEPTAYGDYTIFIETDADTASLKINDEELGGKAGGRYTINRIARAGQDTKLDIVAKDIYGNSDKKTITVSRNILESKTVYAPLNPAQVRRQTDRDAVAIIIGISNYKTLPKAEFANDDARVFYDYAIRALGVKPENTKLLVDADAEDVEIIKTFKTWLPSRVKPTTDVYVYYSGHGLPTQDGQGLYLLPLRADRDFISRTSIQFQEINTDIQAAKPKSVTIFMDACYSGQARSGETLVANARPVVLKAEKKLFPDNFTVIAASQADQISSSSPDLK